jgi:hypothetical protein
MGKIKRISEFKTSTTHRLLIAQSRLNHHKSLRPLSWAEQPFEN